MNALHPSVPAQRYKKVSAEANENQSFQFDYAEPYLILCKDIKKTGCLTQGKPVFNTFFICRKLIYLIYPK